jgi:hypothetical protein
MFHDMWEGCKRPTSPCLTTACTWDFKFSRRRVWSSESSGMYCRVLNWISTSIIRAMMIRALMMEAARTSETSVGFQLRTRRYISEDLELPTACTVTGQLRGTKACGFKDCLGLLEKCQIKIINQGLGCWHKWSILIRCRPVSTPHTRPNTHLVGGVWKQREEINHETMPLQWEGFWLWK